MDASVTQQMRVITSATARPTAAFNAQNAIHLPALQAACNLAAQRRTAAQQAYEDRFGEINLECLSSIGGSLP